MRAAGLNGLSAHGLRKAMCVRLANAGCSPHQIMAISGHLTLSEVTRYTIEVDRARLAQEATDRLLQKKILTSIKIIIVSTFLNCNTLI